MVYLHRETREREHDEYEEDNEEETYYEEEQHETDEPGQFLLFHRGIRTRDGQEMPEYSSNYKWDELRQARTSALARQRRMGRTKSNGIVEWNERGPGNVPGRTRALFNVPNQGNTTWLAGSATGGIWYTSNDGLSWSERSKDFPALPISCFAADAAASVI